MFEGFSREAVDFLAGIREHNEKEWFEEHKDIYLKEVYRPMKELCAEVSKPFMKIDGMMSKAGRIYSDPNFPPYRKYRENMWLIVKHDAWDWSKTPSLFFELSGSGSVFGFKITHPTAATMENFRRKIVTDDDDFLKLAARIEKSGIVIGGDEYKRPKLCDYEKAERFFKKKSLNMTVTLTPDDEMLYSKELSERVVKTFKKLLPVNELFEELVAQAEAEKLTLKLAARTAAEQEMPHAPADDFMW